MIEGFKGVKGVKGVKGCQKALGIKGSRGVKRHQTYPINLRDGVHCLFKAH